MYTNNKTKDEIILRKFNYCIKEFDFFYNKCNNFYNDKKDNKYICTKRIAKLLEDNKYKKTLSYILTDSIIKKDFAPYIYDYEFVSRFKDEIYKALITYGLNLVLIDEAGVFISYKYKTFQPIILECSLWNFSKISRIYIIILLVLITMIL